jgi:NitT/TauT family transport system ATP-binding protein
MSVARASPVVSLSLESFQYAGSPEGAPPVIAGVELALSHGERVFLLGPSGSGKSTLLRVLMGLERGARGLVSVRDRDPIPLAAWGPGQDVFGLVPQVPTLFPWKTLEGNLVVACPGPATREEKRARAQTLLEAVGLAESSSKYPWQVSQGMASRVSFARAQLVRAPCLLLDEPFAALDALTRASLQEWLRARLGQSGDPCLFVTHDVREALSLGTRILVLGYGPSAGERTTARVVADFTNFDASLEWERRVTDALGM